MKKNSFQIKVMSTTRIEKSTTNDINAVDDDGQYLNFLASAFEEIAEIEENKSDLFASVDPSLHATLGMPLHIQSSFFSSEQNVSEVFGSSQIVLE